MALDGLTKHFRVWVASVPVFENAVNKLILDVFVKYTHPCNGALFTNNGQIFLAPLSNFVDPAATHPSPLMQALTDFPYNLQPTVDCGPQTISITATSVITPGAEADFITISKIGGVWTLKIAPNNIAQIEKSFTFQVSSVLDNYASPTITSPYQFTVAIKEPCSNGVVNTF